MNEFKLFDTVDTPFGYKIGRYPVTNREWMIINPDYRGREDFPVVSISFYEAEEFCEEISLATGRKFRLPTDDEWFQCANIDNTTYSGSNNANKVAVYNRKRITVPGTKKPNSLGIYDMSGLVWEWNTDKYIRGGSYLYGVEGTCVTYRVKWEPGLVFYDLGFRLVEDY